MNRAREALRVLEPHDGGWEERGSLVSGCLSESWGGHSGRGGKALELWKPREPMIHLWQCSGEWVAQSCFPCPL